MTAYLLDVNVLLALCDPRHVHHEAAHGWFADVAAAGWATCPLTENAFVRIASQPAYPNRPGPPPVVAALLRRFRALPGHRFWPDSVSLFDEGLFVLGGSLSPGQLTDVYLLGLAARHGGCLATFDEGIPAGVVTGGTTALCVIPA